MKSPFAVAVVAALLVSACGEAGSPVDPSLDSNAARSSSAPANLALPFRGSFQGTQNVTPLGPERASVEVSAAGVATHLGRFTIALPHIVTFATRTAVGNFTIVAANGDQLTGTFRGQAQVGAIVSIVEDVTITGGTGRFTGASGGFRIERVFNPAAGTTHGSFSGTISAPHAGG